MHWVLYGNHYVEAGLHLRFFPLDLPFSQYSPAYAKSCEIINIDDEWGVKLADELRVIGHRVVTFSQTGDANLTAKNIAVSLIRGTSLLLKMPDAEINLTSPLVGRPHGDNMLAAPDDGLERGQDPPASLAKYIDTCGALRASGTLQPACATSNADRGESEPADREVVLPGISPLVFP